MFGERKGLIGERNRWVGHDNQLKRQKYIWLTLYTCVIFCGAIFRMMYICPIDNAGWTESQVSDCHSGSRYQDAIMWFVTNWNLSWWAVYNLRFFNVSIGKRHVSFLASCLTWPRAHIFFVLTHILKKYGLFCSYPVYFMMA